MPDEKKKRRRLSWSDRIADVDRRIANAQERMGELDIERAELVAAAKRERDALNEVIGG